MGLFFSNVLIRSVDSAVTKKFLIRVMRKQGLVPAGKDTGASVDVVIQEGWAIVYGDVADEALAKKAAKALTTNALHIENVDSDYMLIRMFGLAHEDTVVVGTPYDMEENEAQTLKGHLPAWEGVAADPALLLETFKKQNVFSEEILPDLETQLGLRNGSLGLPKSEDGDNAICFVALDSPFVLEGPTILNFLLCNSLNVNIEFMCDFVNRGGVSRGACVILTGAFVQRGDVVVDKISLTLQRDIRGGHIDFSDVIIQCSQAKKSVATDGMPIIVAWFYDFEFPEGVRNDSPALRGSKLIDAEYSHAVTVKFTPLGATSADISDMRVFLQPLTNVQGSAVTPSLS